MSRRRTLLRSLRLGGPALSLVALLAGSPGVEASDERGVRVVIREREDPAAPGKEIRLYRQSHALVVGIDAYQGGWPRLSNAVRDTGLVAEALRGLGFDVTERFDLDSAALEQAFREFFVLKGQDSESRLLVWFAGHGHTEKGEGYLVPADAPLPSQAAGFLLKALSVRRFGEYVRQAKAKHVLAVFDSCFAGTVFSSVRGVPPAAITRATTFPVRQFITSGEADQTVTDDGTFRKLFLRALVGEERADANGDGYVTGDEIGLFLSDRLTNLTANRQTPRYGKLADADWDRGDFVFRLPNSELPPGGEPPPPPPPPPVDPAPRREKAVREAISDYKAAFASLDPRAIRRVYPGISDREIDNLKNLSAYDLEIDIKSIAIEGDRASVSCEQKAVFKSFAGKVHEMPLEDVLVFGYRNGSWVRTQ